MKKQVVHVSVMQTSKVMAVLYLVISLPLVVLSAIPMLFGGQGALPVFMLILLPLLYMVFGYLFTLLGAWVYNLVAARIGGFEFTTVETGAD
ncbi:hypothetical protein [Massilia horti]|uniref:DUF3566 domain-containing protein n=1 Tax=Massilia horti TaxID=2562153 RepID=A0A4Y9T5Z4_9BURK|nr:hypothetical protein [Massilia horti]TFW33545.1 hypothetical protein E4O92_05975 [Massilia horti]